MQIHHLFKIIKNQTIRWIGFMIISLYLFSNQSWASVCHGRLFNPLTDIRLDCFFPLTIGNIKMMGGKNPDTPNPSIPICHCGGNPLNGWGVAIGMWEPVLLIDVTRHPYCMVNLGGIRFSGPKRGEGNISHYNDDNQSFYYFHAIQFPVIDMLTPFFKGKCRSLPSFEFDYLSELDPTWRHENLSNILYPELIPILKNIIYSQMLAAADCVKANIHLSDDKIFWAAGCQGSLYPLTGQVQEYVSGVQAATLIAERGVLLLHRLGLMKDSSPKQLCGEKIQYFLPKSRYRLQLIYPKNKGCFPFGRSTALWESNIVTSTASEDYGFILWKKKNCCNN